jgi:hypothetical protein
MSETPVDMDRFVRDDLERRIAVISSYPNETFGRLSTTELTLAALAMVAVPVLLVWLFA